MTIDDVTDPECLIWIEKVRLARTKEELVDLHHAAAKRRNAAIISAWKQYQPASRLPVAPDDKPAMAPDDNWRVVEQFIADERDRRFQTADERARLRTDAERYRWLRSGEPDRPVGAIAFGPYGGLLNGPELDAAVDRGMLASANEGGRDE